MLIGQDASGRSHEFSPHSYYSNARSHFLEWGIIRKKKKEEELNHLSLEYGTMLMEIYSKGKRKRDKVAKGGWFCHTREHPHGSQLYPCFHIWRMGEGWGGGGGGRASLSDHLLKPPPSICVFTCRAEGCIHLWPNPPTLKWSRLAQGNPTPSLSLSLNISQWPKPH